MALCICGKKPRGVIQLQCANVECKKWWHQSCAGLSSIPKSVAENSENWRNWKCPRCIMSLNNTTKSSSTEIFDAVPANIKEAFYSLKQELMSEFDMKFQAMSQMLQGLTQGKCSSNSQSVIDSGHNNNNTNLTDCNNTGNKIHEVNHNECVLVLDPLERESVSEVDMPKRFNEVVKSINNCLKDADVSFCKPRSSSGSVVLGFPNEKEREKVSKQISGNLELKNNFNQKTPQKLLPKIKLSGISKYFFEDTTDKDTMTTCLKKELFSKNDFLNGYDEQIFEVVFISSVNETLSVVVKLSPELRNVISKNDDKLKLFLTICKVVDQFHVRQCYRCQKFGHTSKTCRADSPVCFYCAKSHKSSDCDNKDAYTCINCSNSKNKVWKESAHLHNAADKKCPIFMQECNKVGKNTVQFAKK